MSDRYLEPYRRSHRSYGSQFEVTLWANPDSQRRRFEVFRQMLPLAEKRLLDAGCSRGDFAAYLLEQGVRFAHYVGVDGLCEVIDFARGRGLPRCEFHCADFVADPAVMQTGEPQVVCISGSLNTMTDEQVALTLDAAWEAAREALLFNFLSSRTSAQATPQPHPARRLDTLAMLDWALIRTPCVRFRQDYFPHGHDATILMQRAPAGS